LITLAGSPGNSSLEIQWLYKELLEKAFKAKKTAIKQKDLYAKQCGIFAKCRPPPWK